MFVLLMLAVVFHIPAAVLCQEINPFVLHLQQNYTWIQAQFSLIVLPCLVVK